MIVRVGRPDVCSQIKLGTTRSVVPWKMLCAATCARTAEVTRTASGTQGKNMSHRSCRSLTSPGSTHRAEKNLHDEAPGQQHLVKQSPHLEAASLRCCFIAQINVRTHSRDKLTFKPSFLQRSWKRARVISTHKNRDEACHASRLSASQPQPVPSHFNHIGEDLCRPNSGTSE